MLTLKVLVVNLCRLKADGGKIIGIVKIILEKNKKDLSTRFLSEIIQLGSGTGGVTGVIFEYIINYKVTW